MSASSSSNDAAQRFRTFLTNDWTRWLFEYPELATVVGVRGFNDRWTDDSPAGIEVRRGHLGESRRELAALDVTALPDPDRVSYRLYEELLGSAAAGVEFGFDPLPFRFGAPSNVWMPLNKMAGIHHAAHDVLDLQPKETLGDLEDLLARYRALPGAVRQTRTLLEAGLRLGYAPARAAIASVPEEIEALVARDPENSALLSPVGALPARVPGPDAERIRRDVRAAYTSEIVPAFADLVEYLRTEYIPACRSTDGWSALPNGEAAYRHLVRLHTTGSLSPSEIHAIGREEVARIRAEMETVRSETGFSGDLAAFIAFLRSDPRFFHASAEAMLDGYRVITKKIDPELPRLFGRLPRLTYGVLPVPEYRAPASPAAYYWSGIPSAGRPGYFYANTYDLPARPRWEMEALALHEAVPGHHLQDALSLELGDLPEFRRYGGYTAFAEGWGLYAESLGQELGLYKDPYQRFGQLTFDAWRAVRLVVDTGIHAMGWTRQQAIDYFRENSAASERSIVAEVDRYIAWPGQALAYKIGQRKIRELRTFAETTLGERFDVRGFHDCVLEQGALPLGDLERRVRAWVDAQAAAR